MANYYHITETRHTAVGLATGAGIAFAVAAAYGVIVPLDHVALVLLLGLFWATGGALTVLAAGYWIEYRELRKKES